MTEASGPAAAQDPAPVSAAPGPAGGEWTVEGVIRCPGRCGLYYDFCGTPADLHEFISEHHCPQTANEGNQR